MIIRVWAILVCSGRHASLQWFGLKHKSFFRKFEMKLTVFCLFAALTAAAQATTPRPAATGTEKIVDEVQGLDRDGSNGMRCVTHLNGGDQLFLAISIHESDNR